MNDVNELTAAILNATVEDLSFERELLPDPTGGSRLRIGCRPDRIKGMAVPGRPRATYLIADDGKGRYWYSIAWPVDADAPEEIICKSEVEARENVLLSLQRFARSDSDPFPESQE